MNKRNYELTLNVTTGKIKIPSINIYNTDKGIFNIKLFLEKGEGKNIVKLTHDEMVNYKALFQAVKSKTKNYVELEGILDETENFFYYDLGSKFNDQVGAYNCQIFVTDTKGTKDNTTDDEIVTSVPFNYNVTASILTGLNAEITANPDLPVLKELINECKILMKLDNADMSVLNPFQKKEDNAINGTDKNIISNINNINSQINAIEREKYDDISISGNELSMSAKGVVKKTIALPREETHAHDNKDTLDKITEEKISSWDSKAEGSHNHDTVYAKKSEIPVVDVDKQYVDAELSKKSPIHEHPYLPNTTKIPTKVSELTNDSGYLTEHQDISGKVDKVTGKGLSTNDLTNALKSNYDNAYTHSQASHAPSNAEANVQSDWNESNASSDAYIKNKPTIPSAYVLPVASATVLGGVKIGAGLSVINGVLSATGGGTADSIDWNNIQNKPSVFTPDTHVHSYNDLTNKPTIPTVDVTKKYVDDELLKKSPIHEHPYKSNSYIPGWDEIQNKPSTFTPATHKHSEYLTEHQSLSNYVQKEVGKGLSTNDLTNPLKTNYDSAYTHSQSAHAPTNAQKNSDITLLEIEAKLKGNITTHTHNQYLTQHQSLIDYAKKTEIPNRMSQLQNDASYAKESSIDTKISARLGDIKIKKLTKQEYDSIGSKDPNCLYIIIKTM